MAVVIMLLWNTFLMKPLKIFLVFLHETGHAFISFITGYGITNLNINLNESGFTTVATGGRFAGLLIVMGGYLGSLFFAALILILRKTSLKKFIPGIAAITYLMAAAAFQGMSFALSYAVIFVIAVFIIYMLNRERLTDLAVEIIGISGLVYVIYDTLVNTLLVEINAWTGIISGWSRPGNISDAYRMGEMTGVPVFIWGLVCLLISLFVARALLREKKRIWGRKSKRA
ncbi:MAG: M50 family metallopeptidase [Eubacteriales bacterium]|nr:M50 family metallopeptidase [Eubacteriales bacterium]